MKLYGHPISATTHQVLTLLAEKGHAAEFLVVDVMAKEHKGEAHLARHPFGHIPVLEDNGFSLYETHAILRYLDRKLPNPPLAPRNVRDCARMDQWLCIEQSYLQPAMKMIFARSYAEMMGLEDPGERVVEQGKTSTAHVLDVAARHLTTHDYLAGKEFSLADLCWLSDVDKLVKLELEQMVGERPAVAAWWRRVGSRPSWRTVMSGLPTVAT